MAANILRGEDPCGMALIPFQIAARQKAAYSVQKEILAKCQLELLNRKPHIRAAKCGEVLSREVLEAARRQMPYVGGVRIRIVRAEMRRHDENIGAISRDAVNFCHSGRDVAYVLDDVRHVDALERV